MIPPINSTSQVIGIIGAGQMGQGIAEVFWLKKHKVLMYDKNPKALERAYLYLLSRLDTAIAKNKVEESLRDDIQDQIIICESLKEFVECNFIIEAVAEKTEIKKEIFDQLNNITTDECILSTNTSSLSVKDLSQFYKDPSRFMGVHFFNPAQILPLVELIPHQETSPDVLDLVSKLVQACGKMPVTCQDSPGFIVNRLLLPLINQAGYMLDCKISTAKDIDKAMCLGANFPMGPLALADFIGLDVVVSILNTFYDKLQQPIFKPATCFLHAIDQGNLGKKTGKGIFEYS